MYWEGIIAGTGSAQIEGSIAFVATPAIIFATFAIRRLEVYFLKGILSNITNPKVAGFAVEAEAPRVT